MIISELKLDPFAGMTGQEISFEKGLNVIIGPNEAGKSTLLNALRMAFFMPTHYRKPVFDQEIMPFIPLSGGDTIRVELKFRLGKDVYTLSKSWGESRESELRLPQGGILADSQAVQDRLGELLVLKEGTFNAVLFANQAGLSSAFKSLSENPEATQDLASILRKMVFETDGVSIEQLDFKIESMYNEYFGRWDTMQRHPENNRGIHNPWKNNVGRILRAYYGREELKQSMTDIRSYEEELEKVVNIIQTLSDEITNLREFVTVNQLVVDDVKRRSLLLAEKQAMQEVKKRLSTISSDWPKTDREIITLKQKLKDYKSDHRTLAKEMSQAETYESNKRNLEKFRRAKKKKGQWETAEKTLHRMKRIEQEDYTSLELMHTKIDQLTTSLAAGKLYLAMTAEKAMKLHISQDFEEETLHALKSGQSFELSAGGEILIRHDDWALKVRSGETDYNELREEFDNVSKEYQALLNRLKMVAFTNVKKEYEAYTEQCKKVVSFKDQFEEILDGDAYEELKAAEKRVSRSKAPRSTGTIGKDQGKIEGKISQVEGEIILKTEQINEWKTEYRSQDHLLELLVDNRTELKYRDTELGKLKPLPKSVKDPDKFIEDFVKKQISLGEKEGESLQLILQRVELESRAPEETREEVEGHIEAAERFFEHIEKEGDAISEIRDAFLKMKIEKDTNTLNPWLEELGEVLAPLTTDRYMMINLPDASLGGAVRADGLEIPFNLLSIGTKVGLGLALRLSMARYFLEGLEGFLILDDPLVDMDPERQKAAARIIQNFAEEKQVIIATCHPAHSDLFGGHCINI